MVVHRYDFERPPDDVDLDGDSDVDPSDYHTLYDCLNGPNQPPKCGP